MLKDIPELKVKDVALAIIPSEPVDSVDDPSATWKVYILNLKQEPIIGVLVASKGYGEVGGEPVKTSVLRHFIDRIDPMSYAVVEPIDQSVFHLSNEYWVSFYINRTIYDKKYLFVPGSILKENFSTIPLINKSGVMIR